MDILNQMIARAKANPQRIVLPEGDEPRTLEAANILLTDKMARSREDQRHGGREGIRVHPRGQDR